MPLLNRLTKTLGILATVATILSFLLTFLTLVFPAWIQRLAQGYTGPVETTSSGAVRADYVESQVQIFGWVALMIVLLLGLALAGLHYRSSYRSARNIAMGKSGKKWFVRNLVLLVPIAIGISLGMFLPKILFQPTNLEELGRRFFLGAWAVRSLVGGFFLGLLVVGVSALAAVAFHFVLVRLPRTQRAGQYQKALAEKLDS